MRFLFLFFFLFLFLFPGFSQGILTGAILDEKGSPLAGASIELLKHPDSLYKRTTADDRGVFLFNEILFGFYKLKVSFLGHQTLTLDSIHFRTERFDFNLNDLILKTSNGSELSEVIIYSEKPLIQSKDGNITFNAGESPLSAGSNASDLLNNVPLVSKDPDGKITVRGKEPRILIDDKPVELNLQQLQDLLESMPGSSIEKIEVMTNPPPQYASEQGGVINIVTKKGTVGMTGRISIYGGTRGETGANASFNYRRQGLTFNINGGVAYNTIIGSGSSSRENLYDDSSNFFNTANEYHNNNFRPSFRSNLTYDLSKYTAFNLVLQLNANDYNNNNNTVYKNINRFGDTYRLRDRNIKNLGESLNPSINFTYTQRTKKAGEMFRLLVNLNGGKSNSDRKFTERYLGIDGQPVGMDSVQQQLNDNNTRGYNFRLFYDLPLSNKKTFFNAGAHLGYTGSEIQTDAFYHDRANDKWASLESLTNHFLFTQRLSEFRLSVRQIISEGFSVTAGSSAERTAINFDLFKSGSDTTNSYWSYLPFANLNKTWKEVINLTIAYRRTIRRPGINELNPTIDFSDPFNIRYGNPALKPSLAHNFDLVLGRNQPKYFMNLGFGFNKVEDIYQSIRTRVDKDTTKTTWLNISGRREYEISSWNGFTLPGNFKINLSAAYTYNVYSDYDRNVRKYRNGGSFTSNLNANRTINNLYTLTSSLTFNRFANPQGTVSSSVSMNFGVQGRLLNKKMIATLNIIDPFIQQENRTATYTENFIFQNRNQTQTRNFRLTLAYNFTFKQKPAIKIPSKRSATEGAKPARTSQ